TYPLFNQCLLVCQGGKILVLPGEGSHWINMDIVLQALHSRGHSLTVMRSNKSWYVKEKAPHYNTITVQVERSLDESFIAPLVSETIAFERGSLALTNFLYTTIGTFGIFREAHEIVSELPSALLDNTELVTWVKDSKFDLLLTDPCWGGGAIVAKYFNLPLVYNVRWLIAMEAHLAIAPSPISYIPITVSGNTDKMTYLQRVKNMMLHIISQVQNNIVIRGIYQKVCEKYIGPDCDYYQLMIDADIWLLRTDFVFDYPRPTMPNVIYMGGFQCKPAKPLPQHLEDFVQSSGDHGFIIMSLGTFVSELPADLANEIAATFAKLPQKVIWRYKGEKPDTLGNNTLLVDWMPQNDLLGHPKIKLFVAHGGTNGIQEALYHGVPVVGIPVFFDQYDNILRLADRGGAKILSIVLTEPSYRNNMQRLSRLHRDQPLTPMDNALFWMEFVMRHKGAAHLKAQGNRMPWYSYHSVDVALFLVGALMLLLFTVFLLLRCLCAAVCKRKAKRD
uniref:UDP-glucuronosyltransferase n=1 Tax=Salarias fasciatus TaxID=181472 RepID=A0A672INL2_SALFA